MRYSAFLGVALAAMVGALGGHGHPIMAPAALAAPQPNRRARLSVSIYAQVRALRPRGLSQPHTGAGGAGAHKRWKVRRASGRA